MIPRSLDANGKVVTTFPQRPDTAQLLGFGPGDCGNFYIYLIAYDYEGDGDADRLEYYLEDEILFAVILFHKDTQKLTHLYILQPDKSIKLYFSIDGLKENPCQSAALLLKK